jgi:hypothetical protein
MENLPADDANSLLLQVLSDSDLGVRKFAVRSVAATHSEPVQAKLRALASNDPAPASRHCQSATGHHSWPAVAGSEATAGLVHAALQTLDGSRFPPASTIRRPLCDALSKFDKRRAHFRAWEPIIRPDQL